MEDNKTTMAAEPVDIGRNEFTYAIVNTKTATSKIGRGLTDDAKAIKSFYNTTIAPVTSNTEITPKK